MYDNKLSIQDIIHGNITLTFKINEKENKIQYFFKQNEFEREGFVINQNEIFIIKLDNNYEIPYKRNMDNIFNYSLENTNLQLESFTNIFDKLLNFKIQQPETEALGFIL